MKRWNLDLQLFAQAPSAELVTLGLGKEITYGSAVSPTMFLIPSTEGYAGTNDLIARPGARARIGQTEALTGLFTGKGSMQVEVDPDSFGVLALLTMGLETVTANASNPSALAVTTTVADANGIPKGFGPCTPAAMTNVVKGQSLTIGTGGGAETVVVRAISATQFYAYFSKPHANGETIVNASVVLAYDHVFTLASPRLSFTAQINHIIATKNAFGSKIAQLSLKLTPKAILEAVAAVEYQGEAHVGSPTSPTFSTLRGLVFNTPGNAATFNGIALDSSVQGVAIDVNVGLVTDYPKLGNGRYRAQLPETQTKVSGSLDLAFESETARQYFWGQVGATGPQGDVLPIAASFLIQSVDYVNTAVPYALKLAIPMLKIKSAPEAMKVGDYLKQTVQWEASESTNGAGDDLTITLTNAASGASF